MKKTNAKKLNTIHSEIEKLTADVEAIRDEEQDSFDAKSEGWQEGDKGQEASEELDSLSALVDGLESLDWPDVESNG